MSDSNNAQSAAPTLPGQCLCGAVRFSATPQRMEMGVCHCGMCRRWTGGAFMSVDCGQSLRVENAEHLGVYNSSVWGQRCFCKQCGSTLFWRTADGAVTMVAAPAFADAGQFVFTSEIFIDERPANFAFANDTHKLTGAEVMAAFAPEN